MQVNSWPSSDPLVTSVGGTQMNLDDAGNRLSPDVVWNDGYRRRRRRPEPGVLAAGLPERRQSRSSEDARGTPDISLNAAVDGGVWVYYTVRPADASYHLFGGTSAATPEFAGIVAMADQVAHHRLGLINDASTTCAAVSSGIVDVTSGNNDIGPFTNSDNITYTVVGFNAGPGYDLASGLGTIDAARFVPALAGFGGN